MPTFHSGRYNFSFFARHSSFMVQRLLTAWLILAASSAFAQRPTAVSLRLPSDPERIRRLQAHGVAPTPEMLTRFLEQGFAAGTSRADLPTTPVLKTQIVIDAIVECAARQVKEAAPTLGRLARGIASPGIQYIIRLDAEQQRGSDRTAFADNVMRTLRLNAIVALGLIGDTERRYELAAVFEKEQDAGIRIPCAIAMATLGSNAGVSYLIDEARRANRTTSVAAADALRIITGLDYGPAPDDPVVRRNAAAKEWRKWWNREGKTFQPDVNRILARRLSPPPRPIRRDPQTVRDLVDCIAYPDDPRWRIDGFEAYQRFRLMGEAALTGLEAIVKDKNENLKVRQQAILIYTQITTSGFAANPEPARQPKRAYKTLRWLRWDRNPEIRETVRGCLERLRQVK